MQSTGPYTTERKVSRKPRKHECDLPGWFSRWIQDIGVDSIIKCNECNQRWIFTKNKVWDRLPPLPDPKPPKPPPGPGAGFRQGGFVMGPNRRIIGVEPGRLPFPIQLYTPHLLETFDRKHVDGWGTGEYDMEHLLTHLGNQHGIGFHKDVTLHFPGLIEAHKRHHVTKGNEF